MKKKVFVKPKITSKQIKVNYFLNSRFFNSYDKFKSDLIPNVYAQSGCAAGPCFITTAVCSSFGLPDDNPILNTLRQFRDTYMTVDKRKINEVGMYYQIAPLIVNAIDKRKDRDKIYSRIAFESIVPTYELILQNKLDDAYTGYKKLVFKMKKEFLD